MRGDSVAFDKKVPFIPAKPNARTEGFEGSGLRRFFEESQASGVLWGRLSSLGLLGRKLCQ